MVESLIARGVGFVFALGASSSGVDALSQTLQDPTKPPSVATTEPALSATATSAAPSRVQSILISPGRKLAVIDGQTVALGGRIGGATLVAVGQGEVTLKRGEKLEVLKLNPGVQAAGAGRE